MANLTEERLKEMEEEMNRFEEEILTSQKIGDVHGNNSADSKVIIGSSTFDQVQAQLNNQLSHPPLEAAEVTTAAQKPENSTVKPRLTFSGTVAPPPPPPPPPEQEQIGPKLPENLAFPL